MGGFYNSEFKCTNCNYLETLRTSPKIIEPINDNIPRAEIEYRWCNNCIGIRSVFTARGYEYNTDRDDTNVNELAKEKETFQQRLEYLMEDRKNIKLNFVQKIFTNLYTAKIYSYIKATKCNIIETEEKIEKYKKSIETSLILTKNAKEFYNSKNSIPKCLCCGSVDVSLVSFENENHTCGGKIIENSLGRGGSTGQITKLKYDESGNSEAGLFTFAIFEEEKLIQKLEKPYCI
jgi:hypothetical protein|tara:strand:- start:88 stop:789 length:702 start_codon:yes stop_codon:yes gene_type:complete